MKLYYVYTKDSREGPFSLDELKNTHITETTMLWTEGMTDWQKASDFPELVPFFEEKKQDKYPFYPVSDSEKGIRKLFSSSFFQKKGMNKKLLYAAVVMLFVLLTAAMSRNHSLRKENADLINEQVKREQELHNRIQEQERLYNAQLDELGKRVLEQEQLQSQRQEEDKQVMKQMELKQLEEDLKTAHQNLEKARKYVDEVSRFQLFRSQGQRESDIRKATDNLQYAQAEFDRLKAEKEAFY